MVGVVGGSWVAADPELTPLNKRIFALNIDTWMSAGGMFEGPAQESSLAVASALQIIPPPSDCLGVYLCCLCP